MKMPKVKIGMAGKFKIVATRPDGTQRVLADWFDNLILDAGLNQIGIGGIVTRCQAGSGSTAPTVGQTALVSLVASTTTQLSSATGYDTVGLTYSYIQITFRFAAGVAAGNLSEVGVGWSAGGGGLFSRALIEDTGGSPTTITVLSDEVLDVTYELRFYLPADLNFSVTISAVSHTCVLRPSALSNTLYGWLAGLTLFSSGAIAGSTARNQAYTGAINAAVTGLPSGTFFNAGGVVVNGSYVNNSLERLYRTTYGLADGNVAFQSLVLSGYLGSYQCSFSPTIAKDSTKILTIDWKLSWARRII